MPLGGLCVRPRALRAEGAIDLERIVSVPLKRRGPPTQPDVHPSGAGNEADVNTYLTVRSALAELAQPLFPQKA